MSRRGEEDPIKWTVAEFLRQFQAIVSAFREGLPGNVWWDPAPRRTQEISDLGLTRSLAMEELLKLKPAHHAHGPEKDHWEEEMCAVHVFRFLVARDLEAYVKIGLKELPSRPGIYAAKIYSFKRWT